MNIMNELAKRWKRGIEKVIKEDDEGTGELEKKWRHALERKKNEEPFFLSEEEAIHTIKKLFNIPTHLKIKEEAKIASKIAVKLWINEILGDPETMFKGESKDERKSKRNIGNKAL